MDNTCKKKYTDEFQIRRYFVDMNEYISPMGIFGFMEVLATDHAEVLNCNGSPKEGYFWILRSSKYKMNRMPINDEIVKVYTWPCGIVGLKSLRRFEFFVGNELIGKGYQYWVSITYDSKKPFISERYTNVLDDLDLDESDMFKLKKIRNPEGLMLNYKKTVLPKDIDSNQHMNNVRYIDVVYNSIPFELLKKYQIVEFHIDYLRECKVYDEVEVFSKQTDNIFYVDGIKNNQSSFKANLKFKKI